MPSLECSSKQPEVTGSPTSVTTMESGIWQIEREWVLSHLSAMKENVWLSGMKIDGEDWDVKLEPSDTHTVPAIFLMRSTKRTSLNVNFAVTIVDPRNPGNSVFHEYDRIFDKQSPGNWGWFRPVAEPCPPGLILDDKLILHTRLRFSERLILGSARRPLLKESQEFATRAYMGLLRGPNSPGPNVTLKMRDDMLPAHRFLLAEASDYFKAMFQTGWTESKKKIVEIQQVAAADMKLVLQFIQGELEAIPEERLHSLALATDRMQAKQLMKHCVTRLKLCLTLETLADMAIVADKMNHEGLQQACIDFAMQEENRAALQAGEQRVLKRVMADAPDVALKLVGELLRQGVSKEAQNG